MQRRLGAAAGRMAVSALARSASDGGSPGWRAAWPAGPRAARRTAARTAATAGAQLDSGPEDGGRGCSSRRRLGRPVGVARGEGTQQRLCAR